MEKLLDLTGKVILITGGCGAIGRVIVQVLAQQGATVIANDIVPDNEAVQMLASAGAQSPNIGYCRADATQPDTVHSMFQQVEEKYGLPLSALWTFIHWAVPASLTTAESPQSDMISTGVTSRVTHGSSVLHRRS